MPLDDAIAPPDARTMYRRCRAVSLPTCPTRFATIRQTTPRTAGARSTAASIALTTSPAPQTVPCRYGGNPPPPPRDDPTGTIGARRAAGAAASARAPERAPEHAADAKLATDDKPITLNFQRAELGAVLNAFARFTGLNIVASETRARLRFAASRQGAVARRVRYLARRQRAGDGAARQCDLGRAACRSGRARATALRGARACGRSRTACEPCFRAALRACRGRTQAPSDRRRAVQRVLSKRGAAMADPRTNLLFVTDLRGAPRADRGPDRYRSTGRRGRC